jgi:hypothetical protein
MFLAFLFRLAELHGARRAAHHPAPNLSSRKSPALIVAWLLGGIVLPAILASLAAAAASHQLATAWPLADHGGLLWAFRVATWALSYSIASAVAFLLLFHADRRLPVRRAAASPAGR